MKTLKDYPTRGGSSPWSNPTSYASGTAQLSALGAVSFLGRVRFRRFHCICIAPSLCCNILRHAKGTVSLPNTVGRLLLVDSVSSDAFRANPQCFRRDPLHSLHIDIWGGLAPSPGHFTLSWELTEDCLPLICLLLCYYSLSSSCYCMLRLRMV